VSTIDSTPQLAQLVAKSGDKLILHIEVQHRYDSNFERRMFSYLSRLQEKYTCPVHSLAILADNRRHWRPSSISLPILDGEIQLRYPIFKLLDYDLQAKDLLGSENPFAVFAAIDLLARHVRHDTGANLALKCRAMQAVFQHTDWPNRTTWLLLSLLDQIIELPVELQSQFEDQMHSMDRRRCNMDIDMELMPRFAEKIRDKAREEGLSQGHQQGRAEGVLEGQRQTVERLLTVRFGKLPGETLRRIRRSSLDELEIWTRNLCDAPTLADVFRV